MNRYADEQEARPYPLRNVLGEGPNVLHRKPWYRKVDWRRLLWTLAVIAVLTVLTALFVGCKANVTPSPVVLHPAGAIAAKEQADCYPTEQPPIIVDDQAATAPKLSWSETHHVKCPDNMRMMFPSQREEDRLYGRVADPNWTVDGSIDWWWQHVKCIPDGQP